MTESFPDPDTYEVPIAESDGLLRYGLDATELATEITFNGHTGTVAQMLGDEKCPVGAMVETTHAQSGSEGVQQVFRNLGQMFGGDIGIQVRPKTSHEYSTAQALKKN